MPDVFAAQRCTPRHHARQHLAGNTGGKDDRFDAAHPFAPAQLGRQIGELAVERDLGFRALLAGDLLPGTNEADPE